ncbi:MAG: LPS export ABC transporter permease LptG [Mesorhizobium sp.]|uniref:LPS export ABC transporter permease LptG n=2 Tax=Mesorhizobium sp. TaxID=1871066 RepID=UPI000FE8367A|nr:LPS export ABC transporter permease LptG [Mesorhizobium sp.]RWL97866.1 MAG: LPS export ABC transporter permease LptG [Mesorhizobium sp.]TIP50320.1 MAG: LPS export ABC transporter permease LptG [Mesorhizobium sp.]TJV73788.1 MAG: LPS export ABC transporter permease LptG [Mesorhizobium sp.]
MGWTLGRYFFFRYVSITFWFFLGLLALVFLIDFTELSGRTTGLPGFTYGTAFAISALRMPMIMLQTVPFVGLFSAMATLVSLNRRYELVIARSAGVSAWQFLFPCCVGALMFGVLSVAVMNPIAAHGFSWSEQMENDLRAGKSNAVTTNVTPWLRQKTESGDTIIGARAILNQGLEMADAVFFILDPQGNIAERKDAAKAFLRDGYWELQDVKVFKAGKIQTLATDKVPTNLKPEFVQERLARPETIPFYELPRKIEVARSFGLKANAFAMQFDSLVALPFLLVAMTLIAATVSMRFARMGQSATMILGGVVAGFLLYVVSVLVKAFGVAGFVPTVVAAWVPVVVAMFFGVTFLLYKEDG